MSDFLISFDPATDPRLMLELLQAPYGSPGRAGWSRKYSWGCIALLEDLIARRQNIVEFGGGTAGWVGDAPAGRQAGQQLLEEWLLGETAWSGPAEAAQATARSRGIRGFGGACAVMIAGRRFAGVVTDPMSAVQVYLARSPSGEAVALGTHVDLVAQAAGYTEQIDPVSVGEFLNTGTPCWPNTMYTHVKELDPGHVFAFDQSPEGTRRFAGQAHWKIPEELKNGVEIEDLANEFARSWVASVGDRCQGQAIGIQLSGGLDSRIISAVIPKTKKCVGLTYCDEMNRETRIARRVARVYGCEWQALRRDKEYVARTATDVIRFIGCEGEWHHAHAIGLATEINGLELEDIFTGLFMDNNFKGYYARDLVAVRRCRGLLPPVYRRETLDYSNHLSEFCRLNLTPEIQESIVERRRQFFESHRARGRQSEWEWLDGHPLSQASDNTGWMVERRLFPMRLPVNDPRLVDLAFRVPARSKVSGEFFTRAALKLLGPGARVVNANDGVRPGSGHAVRLLQRGVRKAQNTGRQALGRIGIKTQVPHSWHDYQSYWRESPSLESLRSEHGKNLEAFGGGVFTHNPQALLARRDIPWRTGCRLLQLAVWLSIRPKSGKAANVEKAQI